MKVPDFPLTTEMLDAMLLVSRVTNESMRNALNDHLVLGESQVATAQKYGYTKQQLQKRVKRFRDEVKPAFDLYAVLASGGAGRQSAG
ncbi:hypothetical protein HQ619_07635 [Burkholderia gladioli]|jgi:hypothetical protein|uniref:hypothetical protein n=1 Tax=Burkholderia gladioli TaxID=28095 RepID=UPI00156029C6|nr:hypothetical protein [Burkholderia gladioli]NRF83797.1 hypothetical protein [Burkholderia gladioli]